MEVDQRQYCLKWNNHPRNIANVFERLRHEELFVDVSLATSDKQIIRAHRVLLSAGSGYLEKVLAFTPSEHPTVVLPSVKYKDLKLLVDFMYSGEISVDQQQFPSLLEAARWLKIRGLYEDSEEFTEEPEESTEKGTKPVERQNDGGSELIVSPKKGDETKVQQVPNGVQQVPSPKSRKRNHSEESEEEQEVQSPISSDAFRDEGDTDTSFDDSNPVAKQMKPLYGHLQGVANAVWMMNQGKAQQAEMAIDNATTETPDLPNLLNLSTRGAPSTESQMSPTKPILSPSSLNEQLIQAMQLCTNPYLAAMQKPLELLGSSGSHSNPVYSGSYSMMSNFNPKSLSPNSKSSNRCLLTSAPVRRYKQYSDESLQAALKEIMNGQSINRSSMKHNIPARTLRDWMKRYNIKSQFTHHSHGKDSSRSNSQEGEEKSHFSPTSELGVPLDLGILSSPLTIAQSNAIFSQSSSAFPGMKLNVSATVKQEEEIDDDEDRNLEIDEGPLQNNLTQIAQIAN